MVFFLLGKPAKLKTFITGLALHQLFFRSQLVDNLIPEKNQISEDIVCTCKLECWTTVMLFISILGITGFWILKAKKTSDLQGIFIFQCFLSDAIHVRYLQICPNLN